MDDSSTDGEEGQVKPDEVFEEYLARMDRGEDVDFDALCEENPSVAHVLRKMNGLFTAVEGHPSEPPTSKATSSGLFQGSTDQRLQVVRPKQHAKGDQIGDFQLVECIGIGGMGEVWEAIQLSLSRRVAIKFLLTDRVNTHGLNFFEREARAGGRLEHKGIVSVYSCGEDDGVHWIAMELVSGGCDLRRSLDALAREAELPDAHYTYVAEFTVRLAEALEAVHQAGVIHRDLKPGNILVTPDERPKISDFGLAKLIDEASLSMAGDMAGTYFYMSPEQVASKRAGLDSRTDIFSLGVVLYEMLTFVRPFDGDTTQQVTGKIMWEDPVAPQVIRSRIPRDLATICGKAMEKDPSRRYQSMAALAADIRRHLAGEPIWAKPSSLSVRAFKWARRNPTKCAVTLIASIAMVVIMAIAWQLYISKQQAERSRQQAEHIADFQGQMLQGLDAFAIGQVAVDSFEQRLAAKLLEDGADQAGRERILSEFRSRALRAPAVDVAKDIIDEAILIPASALLADEFADSPATEAILREAMARTYNDLGLAKKAQAQQEQALGIRRELHTDRDAAHWESLIDMAQTAISLEEYAKARSYLEESLAGLRDLYGPAHESSLTAEVLLATTLSHLDDPERAADMLAATLRVVPRSLGSDHPLLRKIKHTMARLCERSGDQQRAGELLREVFEATLRIDGDVHKNTLSARFDLARWHYQQGQLDDAANLFLEVASGSERLRGRGHPNTLAALTGVLSIRMAQRRPEDALPLCREISRISRQVLGSLHSSTMTYILNEAGVLTELGRHEEARPLMEEAVSYFGRLPAQLATYRRALHNLGLLEYRVDNLAAAEQRFRELLKATPEDHPEYAQCRGDLEEVVEKRKALKAAGQKGR
jgi:serine/threonine protein kinase/tetratricopeptide (TPR) repeat protein